MASHLVSIPFIDNVKGSKSISGHPIVENELDIIIIYIHFILFYYLI